MELTTLFQQKMLKTPFSTATAVTPWRDGHCPDGEAASGRPLADV